MQSLKNIALRQQRRVLAGPTNQFVMCNTRPFGYHKNVLDHYENPRNVGSFDKSEVGIGTGLVGAPACGDVMKL